MRNLEPDPKYDRKNMCNTTYLNIKSLNRGESITYFSGYAVELPNKVKQAVRVAHHDEIANPVQRKIGHHQYDYIAQRK